MGILETLKDFVTVVQKADNIDLMKGLLEVQTQTDALLEESLRVKAENAQLREQLATRDRLQFKRNAYWMDDAGPFCSKCWDSEAKLVRLHVLRSKTPWCPACKTYAHDPDATPRRSSGEPPRGSGSWTMG